MIKVRTGFLLLIMILIFPASIFSERIALITDPYWNEILEKDIPGGIPGLIRDKISDIVSLPEKDNVRIAGKRVPKIIFGIGGTGTDEILMQTASGINADIIILSPLLGAYACKAASMLPEKMFFLIGSGQESECSGDNIVIFKLDYGTAFEEAGRWAASRGGNVRVLVYTGSEEYRERYRQFKTGWALIRPESELHATQIMRFDGSQTETIRAFTGHPADSGDLTVLFAGPENKTAAEDLDGTPSAVLTAGAEMWSNNGYNLAASIEIRPQSILSAIIKSISTESYENEESVDAEFFVYE